MFAYLGKDHSSEEITVPKFLFELVAEYGLFTVIFGAISFMSWTKMTLGAALSVIGAFFPANKRNKNNNTNGIGAIKILGAEVTFSGAARYAVIVGGILLILGSIFDGASLYASNKTEFSERTLNDIPTTKDLDKLDEISDRIKALCESKQPKPSFCK